MADSWASLGAAEAAGKCSALRSKGTKEIRHLVVIGRKRHFSSNEHKMASKNISVSFFLSTRKHRSTVFLSEEKLSPLRF